jgi:myo-inositol-1(or 4)-monophosphatase
VRVRDFGSTALEMAYVAANRIDVFWISRPKSWDIAAGVLIIEEAGGSIEFYHPTEHSIASPRNLFAC